ETSVKELSGVLSSELRDELERLSLPFEEGAVPSDAELRIAHAQLVGWLEGLFHGIQAMLFAQQMESRQRLDEMRRPGLPAGRGPGDRQPDPGEGTYL
ncbi:MAG: proteasome activator, partial [Actinomycetota bacterium]